MTNTVAFPGLGLEFTINRVAFTLGNIPIYWYGILIGGGFVLAMLYALQRSKEFGVDSDRMIDVIFGGAVLGIIGARLYYVAFRWDYYSQDLTQIFNTRSGGMAIYGGIVAGFLGGWLMCRLRKVKILPAADLAATGFLLGQGIGRWGNFVNEEAFGGNTSLPWGMTSPVITEYLAAHEAELEALGMNIDPHMPVHPTFLYESVWCLLGFALLVWYTKRRKFDGELLLLYGIWYGAERMIVEGLRTDSLIIPGTSLRASQVLAAVLVVVCAVTLVVMRRKVQEKLRLDPAAPILYRDTEEGKQVIAGTFYPKKGKAKADEAVQEVQQPEAELDELDAAVEPDEEEVSSPEEADAPQEAAPEEAALEDQEPERVDPETTDNEEEGQAPKEQ